MAKAFHFKLARRTAAARGDFCTISTYPRIRVVTIARNRNHAQKSVVERYRRGAHRRELLDYPCTVEEVRSAAEANDIAALSEHVDFPEVKESLKASVNAQMVRERTGNAQADAMSALGTAVAAAIMGPVVDALLTPQSLAMIIRGENPRRADSRDSHASPGPEANTEAIKYYENINRFVVQTRKKGSSEEPLTLVFSRDGLLTWKLTALRVPM